METILWDSSDLLPWIRFCKQSKVFPDTLYRLNVLRITSQQTWGSNEYICRKWFWIMDGRTKSLSNVLILPSLIWMRKERFRHVNRSANRNCSLFNAKLEAQNTDSTTFQLKIYIYLIYVLNCMEAHQGSCSHCRMKFLSFIAQTLEYLPHNLGGTICRLEERAAEMGWWEPYEV